MAWTTPGTATAGEVLTASFWNEQVRDNTQQLRDDRGPVFIKSQSFSAASSVIVTAAFSSLYRVYDIVFRDISHSTGSAGVQVQLRSGSTTETSANYAYQYLFASSTSTTAARSSGQTLWAEFANANNLNAGASVIRVFHPFEATRTTFVSTQLQSGGSSAILLMNAGDLGTTTSYDQFVISVSSGTITGTVRVYGWAAV